MAPASSSGSWGRSLSLATIMLEQLATARRIVEDGHEVVPAWRITTAEGTFLILTRFDTDKDKQRDRAQFLISRFMAWKMATSFVLTEETWLGAQKTRVGDEALLAVGVSHHERLAAIQRIRRGDALSLARRSGCSPTKSTEHISECSLREPPSSAQRKLPSWPASSAKTANCAPTG